MNLPNLTTGVRIDSSVGGPPPPRVSGPGGVTPSGGGGVPNPAPGCWFVGTECRIGYQTCKYCCGNGQSYTQQCGWCIGWYDAPPCF